MGVEQGVASGIIRRGEETLGGREKLKLALSH